MGVSTNGQICYGIKFDEGAGLPWDEEPFYGDIDKWWLIAVNGFKPSFEIYDSEGEYINGVEPSKETIEAYYAEKRAAEKAQPELPYSLVNYCSGEYPVYILSLKRTELSASRGYPEEFDPTTLTVTAGEKAALIVFCQQHNIEIEGEPKWWLSSYWG